VFHRVEVLCGVLVLGRIATSYVTARQTEAQVHPTVAGFEAFFAALFAGMPDLNLIQMLAGFTHTVQCRKDNRYNETSIRAIREATRSLYHF
jgi:hypothetical protein